MTKWMMVVGILMCATFAVAEKHKPVIQPPADTLCCRCCSGWNYCEADECHYCTLCPAFRDLGKTSDRAIDEMVMESLGVKLNRAFPPMREASKSCRAQGLPPVEKK